MPRGFSEQERILIRERLLARGYELLASHGARKISVDDLVHSVGISKGAFYAFFDSKEALLFDVLETFEARYRRQLLSALPTHGAPHDQISQFLLHAMTLWHAEPLFRRFDREEFAYLTRKIPPERVAANLQHDQDFSAALFAHWQTHGITLTCTPEVFTAMLRGLFFMDIHADEIGPAFAQAQQTMIAAIAAYCTTPTAAPL
jgi:AcrR family transcriptional regulator